MANAWQAGLMNRIGFATYSSASNHVVDASNEGVAYVFNSFIADAITKLFFRYGSRTGTPPSYIAALEGVDGSGNPDGTVKGGGSPASVVFTPPASTAWDSLGQWVTLANPYTPAIGELLAMTIRHSSGTIDASNNSSFCSSIGGNLLTPQRPYGLTNSGGTWSKITTALAPFGYQTASGRYGFIAQNQWTTLTTTSGRRQAAGITIPSAFGSTFKPLGFTFFGTIGSVAGQTAKLAVWDTSGTEIASAATIDVDQQAIVTNQGNWTAIFTSPPTLNCGEKYYFGAESISGSGVCIRGNTLTEADDRLAWPLGTNRVHAEWNGTAWTETNTTLPALDLILDDIVVPSGSGGSILIGGSAAMRGGFLG